MEANVITKQQTRVKKGGMGAKSRHPACNDAEGRPSGQDAQIGYQRILPCTIRVTDTHSIRCADGTRHINFFFLFYFAACSPDYHFFPLPWWRGRENICPHFAALLDFPLVKGGWFFFITPPLLFISLFLSFHLYDSHSDALIWWPSRLNWHMANWMRGYIKRQKNGWSRIINEVKVTSYWCFSWNRCNSILGWILFHLLFWSPVWAFLFIFPSSPFYRIRQGPTGKFNWGKSDQIPLKTAK